MMAIYLTFHSVRRVPGGLFALISRSDSFGARILTAFGMFGLAANGMSLAALTQLSSRGPESGPRDRELTIQTERSFK